MTQESYVGLTPGLKTARVDDVDSDGEVHGVDGHEQSSFDMPEPQELPKKKKKKKSKSRRGMAAPSGFEEYFADAPLTPEEAEAEREEVYSPDRPFHERIEASLHRWQKKRLLRENKLYFDEYLFMGGIDTMISMFQGGMDLEGATASEIKDLKGVETVHTGSGGAMYYNSNFPEHWDVDFTGVLAGYLSTSVPRLAGGNLKAVKDAVAVVNNYLNYLHKHDVCPEYMDDVRKAIDLCKTGLAEMTALLEVNRALPGQFNLACQELFLPLEEQTYFDTSFKKIKIKSANFDPKVIYSTALAVHMPSRLEKGPDGLESTHVVGEKEMDLEVVGIRRPDEKLANFIRGVSMTKEGTPCIFPVGLATCRSIRLIHNGVDPGEYVLSRLVLGKEETILLDDVILEKMKVGMKICGTVCELSNGVSFFKDSPGFFPSFYVFLPQTLMRYYKAPVENTRPPPSASNPFADEENGGEGSADDKESGD